MTNTGALPVNNISSDILSSNGITYVPSKLRLFRTFDGTIHIHTQREGDGMQEFYSKGLSVCML